MLKLLEIFSLEMKSLVRSKTLGLLLVASAAWMLVMPSLVRSDGTADGARELVVRYSLGGVFVLLVIALVASATGTLARERAAKRLQLSMIRPVRYWQIAFGKIAAHVVVGAFVLAVACGILAGRADLTRPCNHMLAPRLPSPREEAKTMYASYMSDPKTPDVVKKAKPEVVLRLLENRAIDHYQVIRTNETASWSFLVPPREEASRTLSVRLRFTNQYEMRQSVRGTFRLAGAETVISNMTQAILVIPLAGEADGLTELSFTNAGESALMLRPRRDIALMAPADAFGWNLLRAFGVLTALLALVVSFGVFLSAGLSRPVAIFVAFVALAVSEMSPSVLQQYPDELETNRLDRIGLALTRAVSGVVRPISSVSPLEALSKDECVETREMVRVLATDLLAVPLVLSFLAAFLLPRKQDGE